MTSMLTKYDFFDHAHRLTSFARSGESLHLAALCGWECSWNGAPSGPARTRGLLALETEPGICAWEDFRLLACQAEGSTLEVECAVGTSGLVWGSSWRLDAQAGLWSRQDKLANRGEKACRLRRLLARFPFAPGNLDIYAQASSWAHESQGSWVILPAGELTLRCQAGRTNQGASPYLFLRRPGTDLGLAFHLLPRGNWVIHLDRTETAGGPQAAFSVVELGLSDDPLDLELPPGAEFALPEVLVQAVPSGLPELGAPALQRYALGRFFAAASGRPLKAAAPLVYNTWFDAFEVLEVGRLRDQLAAAREVGCEVFVVDAGWYGRGSGAWDRQVGDWREKVSAAFHGRMADFAEQVRRAGLGFGLWMEPERFAPGVPALDAHPGWFLPAPWGYSYPDLTQRPVYNYLLGEISRLVESYRLAWMKIDFNLEMGTPADELAGYYQAWYGLLDELRLRYPETFFEGCASGGMRLELNSLVHFDGHFLSDTVNPLDVLRITQAALLRLPPGRLARWAVLRPAGRGLPRYGLPLDQAPERLLTPGSAGWEDAFVAEADFVCRAALPGMLGFSGDLAGLPPQARLRLSWHADFYKAWRNFLTGSVGHLLTPVQGLAERTGWVAFQLQGSQAGEASLVLAYRLDDGSSRRRIPLRELEPEHVYTVTNADTPDQPPVQRTGRELTGAGLMVELTERFRAGIYIVRP